MLKNPENLNLEQIKVGMSREFSVSINEEMAEKFADLSGDFNPLHMDESYAKNTKFGKRVVHGMLLASFFSRLVGMYLPGKKALYLLQNLRFKNPAFIGDNLTVIGKVTAVSEQLKLVTLETLILNFSGQTLVEGEAKVSIL